MGIAVINFPAEQDTRRQQRKNQSVVGGYDENGNSSPYKLTFVLKCNQDLKVDDAKADYKANQKGKKVS